MKPLDEIYPVWPNNTSDPKVANMIQDIIADSLDESFWPVSLTKTPKRKNTKATNGSKKKVKKDKMKINKGANVKDASDGGMTTSLLEFLKDKNRKEKAEAESSSVRDLGIMQMLEALSSQFVLFGEKMNKMKGNISGAQEKMAEKISEMGNNFQELQQNVSNQILMMEAKLQDENKHARNVIDEGPSSSGVCGDAAAHSEEKRICHR